MMCRSHIAAQSPVLKDQMNNDSGVIYHVLISSQYIWTIYLFKGSVAFNCCDADRPIDSQIVMSTDLRVEVYKRGPLASSMGSSLALLSCPTLAGSGLFCLWVLFGHRRGSGL